MIPARTEQAASLYIATFAGRTDAYSIWTGDQWAVAARCPECSGNRTHVRGCATGLWFGGLGEVGKSFTEREPLTPDVVINAFQSGVPISAYVLAPDSSTHLAALDIDREDGMELGGLAARKIDELGGVGYVEPSRRGCHFWIVMNDSRPAILVRRALKGLITEAGLPDDPHIELRPGSDRLNEEGSLGHCIRMPTMPHQKTGKRYVLFSSRGGEKLPAKLADMMLEIEDCPASIMDDLAERAPLPNLPPPPRGIASARFGDPITDDSASGILRSLWGAGPDAIPDKLIKCVAHGPDRRPSLHILKDDQRVICFAAGSGCILHNDGRGRGTRELRSLAPGGTA